MCENCGCQEGLAHLHHGHHHAHDHSHTHVHEPSTREITLEARVLEHNDALAEANRIRLQAADVMTLNFISSPGTGKTALLEKTLENLGSSLSCGVIVADVETDRDAMRLKKYGSFVHQIQTHDSCHLDARRVQPYLDDVAEKGIRLLFIENVGNLVCPAAFDLGEHFKVALLSVTEGDDKPLKYPTLFHLTPVVVLTKLDLLPYVDFDVTQAKRHIRRVRPDAKIFTLSSRTGEGMESWLTYLKDLVS